MNNRGYWFALLPLRQIDTNHCTHVVPHPRYQLYAIPRGKDELSTIYNHIYTDCLESAWFTCFFFLMNTAVEPFDSLEDGKGPKLFRKEKPNEDDNISFWMRLKHQWSKKKLNPTLIVIVPLIVLIEVAMNYNMLIIPPGFVSKPYYHTTCSCSFLWYFSLVVTWWNNRSSCSYQYLLCSLWYRCRNNVS